MATGGLRMWGQSQAWDGRLQPQFKLKLTGLPATDFLFITVKGWGGAGRGGTEGVEGGKEGKLGREPMDI